MEELEFTRNTYTSMFHSFPAFVVEGRTQLLYLSPSVYTVSISLGSILSFLQIVILFFFYLSFSLSRAFSRFSCSHHSGNIHILSWFHLRPMLRICYATRIYVYITSVRSSRNPLRGGSRPSPRAKLTSIFRSNKYQQRDSYTGSRTLA